MWSRLFNSASNEELTPLSIQNPPDTADVLETERQDANANTAVKLTALPCTIIMTLASAVLMSASGVYLKTPSNQDTSSQHGISSTGVDILFAFSLLGTTIGFISTIIQIRKCQNDVRKHAILENRLENLQMIENQTTRSYGNNA